MSKEVNGDSFVIERAVPSVGMNDNVRFAEVVSESPQQATRTKGEQNGDEGDASHVGRMPRIWFERMAESAAPPTPSAAAASGGGPSPTCSVFSTRSTFAVPCPDCPIGGVQPEQEKVRRSSLPPFLLQSTRLPGSVRRLGPFLRNR